MKESTCIKKHGPIFGPIVFLIRRKIKSQRELPWVKTYFNIKSRCSGKTTKGYYYKNNGIECLVVPNDLRDLYLRDKAWLLKNPSIDRINPDLSYSKDNLRWIEFDANRKGAGLGGDHRRKQYQTVLNSVVKCKLDLHLSNHVLKMILRRIISELPSLSKNLEVNAMRAHKHTEVKRALYDKARALAEKKGHGLHEIPRPARFKEAL